MFCLALILVPLVATALWLRSIVTDHGPTPIDSESVCKRFETLEVLQRYRWERSVLPWTTEEAKQMKWNKVSRVPEYSLDMYRFKDVNNFFIFFYKNNLVGVGPSIKSDKKYRDEIKLENYEDDVNNIGVPKAMIKIYAKQMKNVFRTTNHGIFKRSIKIDSMTYIYALILFADPYILRTNAAAPCSSPRTMTVYFEGKQKHQWYQAPVLEKKISKKTPELNKQGCLDRFGHYYFYGLDNDTKCKEIHGFFSFYDERGFMSGFGAFYKGSDVLWEDETNPHPLNRFINVQQAKEMVPNNEKCVTSEPAKGYTTVDILLKSDSEIKDFKCKSKETKQLN